MPYRTIFFAGVGLVIAEAIASYSGQDTLHFLLFSFIGALFGTLVAWASENDQ